MSSLVQLAEREVLAQLKKAVNMSQATANYCCGGSIPISAATDAPEARATKTKKKKAKTNPKATSSTSSTSSTIVPSAVAIRWDIPNEANLSKKILFPFVPENSDNQAASLLDDLLGACAPATFGLDGQDVLDVGYRKAGKLDRKQFSVDFNPYEHSIIDAISQILLPDIKGPELKDREEQRGVMAELYKLNVSLRFQFSVTAILGIYLALCRSIQVHRANLKLMSTLLEELHSSAPLWFACLIPIKVDSYLLGLTSCLTEVIFRWPTSGEPQWPLYLL
jgi:hypothetical protein